jgi:hypothetical protein
MHTYFCVHLVARTNHIQFATPCCPSASTVCLTCTFAEPQNRLPKSGHEHYHDSLNIAYIISHINTEFWIASWGACQPWTHFQYLLVPRSFLINWPFETCTSHSRDGLCTVCTEAIPAPIALKIFQDAHFSASFLNMQAELVSF